jgi:hypothetical protein
MIEVEVCLFNSLAQYAEPGNGALRLRLPEGTRADALLSTLAIPACQVYAGWRNGRDIMTTFGGPVLPGVVLAHGDRIAFSGPIPFSRGYGAPVC